MLAREKDPFFIEMEREQKFQDDNIVETLIHLGFPEMALEVLEEEYKVKIQEYNGQVLIGSDVSKYGYYDNSYTGFNELGFFMIKTDIRFLNDRSTFQLETKDVLELGTELVKEFKDEWG